MFGWSIFMGAIIRGVDRKNDGGVLLTRIPSVLLLWRANVSCSLLQEKCRYGFISFPAAVRTVMTPAIS